MEEVKVTFKTDLGTKLKTLFVMQVTKKESTAAVFRMERTVKKTENDHCHFSIWL